MGALSALGRHLGLSRELASLDRAASRREWLVGGGLLAAFWGREARAGSPPSTAEQWLVQRITMGQTQEELQLAATLGYDAYLQYHLDYTLIDDSALDTRLLNYPTLTMTPAELVPQNQGTVQTALSEATVLRSTFSKRQLFERMVEFWTDHLNIDMSTGLSRWLKTFDDRVVQRTHALGKFYDLLLASAQSPAMLDYLDNASSYVGLPNENYSRELMELHTMGVDGGYTQEDVEEVARCFTGWTINQTPGPQRYSFQFRADRHDFGQKVVLGNIIPAGGGIEDGLMVLDILTHHPSTASFISRKLCSWFWGENPPQTLVDNVAATYTATEGDIRQMIWTLFHDPASTPAGAPPKYKRPYHLVISALRATDCTVTNWTGIRTELQAAGHVPYRWPSPDGYSDKFETWYGLVLPRWNYAAKVVNNASPRVNGVTFDVNAFFAGVANTADASIAHINAKLFGGAMPAADADRVRDYMLPDPPSTARKREAVGLALSCPAFQWY